jgi:hypothetical protein
MKEGVCRACLFFPFVKPDIEKLIKARRTLYHINSAKLRLVRADRSLRSFGDEAGYSGMTIHRFENEEAWIEVPGIIPVDGSKREYRLDWHVLREVAGFVSPGVLMEELDWKFDKLKKYCRPNRRWVKGTVLTIITHVVHKSCL